MGVTREHPGHSADARRRIDDARIFFARRRERRPPQRWVHVIVTCTHDIWDECSRTPTAHTVTPGRWEKGDVL